MGAAVPDPRRATRADVPALSALWAALLRDHADIDTALALTGSSCAALEARILDLLGDPRTRIWIAGAGAETLGFCAAHFEVAPASLAETGRVSITELFVRDSRRRSGLGRALAEAAFAWAKERGAERVEVRVAVRNAAGQGFWRALGFGDFVDVLHRRL